MLSKNAAKYIQSLQHKKFRDQAGVFVAEGPKLVAELLAQQIFRCEAIYAVENALFLQQAAQLGHTNIEIVKDFELQKISSLSTAHQVLAIFRKKQMDEQPNLSERITLVLDEIQDPGNLGTIIRLADWFAIENIFCSFHSADMYNAKVVQSTMASLGRVNIVYTDLENFLGQASQKKFATVLDGTFLQQVSIPTEAILIIGNEANGISPRILHLVDEKITIQKFGAAESLNAAVATAIALQHFKVGV